MSQSRVSICKPLSGDELQKFVNIFNVRKSKFGISPAMSTLLIWVLLTTVYIITFVYIEKAQESNEDDSTQKRSIAEGILLYFSIVLPICLVFYAWRVYSFGQLEYHIYYPEATWPGGGFWGSATMIVLFGIIIGVILLQYWNGTSLSAFWITALIMMSIFLSVAIGALSHVLIQCKLTPPPGYVDKFKCAEQQILQHSRDVLEQSRLKQQQAQKTLTEQKGVEQALTGQTSNVEAASRAITTSPNISREISSRATESSRPAAPIATDIGSFPTLAEMMSKL